MCAFSRLLFSPFPSVVCFFPLSASWPTRRPSLREGVNAEDPDPGCPAQPSLDCCRTSSFAPTLAGTLKRRPNSLYAAEEFFTACISNAHTRRASAREVRRFIAGPCAALSTNWLSTVSVLIRRPAAPSREMRSPTLRSFDSVPRRSSIPPLGSVLGLSSGSSSSIGSSAQWRNRYRIPPNPWRNHPGIVGRKVTLY